MNKKVRYLTLICLVLLGLSLQNIFPQSNNLRGDVNNDNTVTIVDALYVAQHYVGLNPPEINLEMADVDGNGVVNIIDALMIAQYYVGLITQFPADKSYSFTGTLNNGLINSSPVSYITTASFSDGVVTITFDGGMGFEWVWLYSPGHTNMQSLSGTIWSVSLSGYTAGQSLEYYFTVRKDGQEANNNNAAHFWVIGTAFGSTPAPTPALTPAPTPTPTPENGWKIVWEDQFNGSGQPDSNNWNYHVGNGYNNDTTEFQGWGNGEWEWYRPQNAYQENGNLVIRAEYNTSPTTLGGRDWYQFSSRLTTQGRHSWQYGRFEARIALPSAAGSWPAFWAMGSSCNASYTSRYNSPSSYFDTMASNWSSCGEIDIMEHRNTENMVVHNLFWDNRTGIFPWGEGLNSYNVSEGIYVGDITQYHLYTVEWDNSQIRWYVDRQTNPNPTKTVSITASNQEEFHKPFFLILNLALQGGFTGPTDPLQSDFPLYMYIDYIRVWQQ